MIAGCGGGGTAGPSPRLSGLILLVGNATPPSPGATIQVGDRSTTSAADGFFSFQVPAGTTNVLVTYTPPGSSTPVTFRFDFPAVTSDRDLGDLVIGPEKISVRGTVRSTADNATLAGAAVSLAGQSGTSDASGRFALTNIPYDSARPNGFLGLEGRAGRTGFFTRTFNPSSGPSSGVATVEDILLQPDSGDVPPGTPATLEGFVTPSAQANGAIIEAVSGSTVVRRFTVGADARYGLWLPVGTYTVRAFRPSAPSNVTTFSITLTSPTQVIRRDVALP